MNAIITGASKGIGKAIAEKLVSQGMNVAICARNENDLAATVNELKSINSNVQIFSQACDLSNTNEVKKFGNNVLAAFDTIHLLINNAGTFIPGDISNEAEGNLENLINLNLYSAYHLTRTILPSMMKNDNESGTRGHIINMSSVAALKAYTHGGAYSISKYALEGFSKNLREELKPHLIKVTSIQPGATMSDSWKGSGIADDRIMRAQDIADMVWAIYNLSPQAVVEDILLRPQLGDL